MTIARKRQVHPEITPYYHVINRCVRRAFLCGFDKASGKDFEHRRQWFVERLALLAQAFAVEVVAYTVMSNHFHLVLRLAPEKTKAWTPDEVIERWSMIYGIPHLIEAASCPGAPTEVVDAARELVEIRRERLGDLSWFMKCLVEPIARMANREDGCTGAFWEGRFKSQALLDEKALLACMAYVDLNPIRAEISESLHDSGYTSVQQRIRGEDTVPLVPFQDQSADLDTLPLKLYDYLMLVEWTGRVVLPGKRGWISQSSPSILRTLGFEDHAWAASMKLFKNAELQALGPLSAIRELARRLSRHWFRGQGECQGALGLDA